MENTIAPPSEAWKKLHDMISKPKDKFIGVASYIAENAKIDINYIPPSPSVQSYLPLLHRALCCATVPDLKNILTVPGIDVNLNCPGLGTPLFQLHDVYLQKQNEKVFLDLLKTFVSHPGVNINAIHEENMILYVVLHYYKYDKINSPPDIMAQNEETAHSAAVEIMKDAEFNVNANINKKGQSLLLYAAEYIKHVSSLLSIFKEILCNQQLELNIMDANNMTVIRHTFTYLREENITSTNNKESEADIIKQYIEDERYLAETIHTDGSTDLHWLVRKDLKEQTAVTSYLLRAKPQMDVNVQNEIGETVFDIIMNQKGLQYQEDDIKLLDMLSDLLLHRKLDRQFLNKKYENGLTVMHVLFTNAELINEPRLLVKWLDIVKMEEIDHNSQDKNGYAPIMYAVKNKNEFSLKAVKIILKVENYDINIRNEHEQTVFDIVNEKDIDHKMLTLIKDARNKKEKSVLDYISEISMDDQIQYLKKSIQRNIHFSGKHKEDLCCQLEGLVSDMHHYNSGNELEMSKEHREKIRGCRVYLIDNLETTEIMDHLIQDGIITDHQAEEINLQGPRRYRIFKLLSILPTQGPDAFDKFINALRETRQEYIAEKLEGFNPEQNDVVATNVSGSVAVGSVPATSDIVVPVNIPANTATSLTFVFNSH